MLTADREKSKSPKCAKVRFLLATLTYIYNNYMLYNYSTCRHAWQLLLAFNGFIHTQDAMCMCTQTRAHMIVYIIIYSR